MTTWIARSAVFLLAVAATEAAWGQTVPDGPAPGFVYLRDADPSIRQDMRYAKPENFTGKTVDGYEAGECILTKATAEALSRAQKNLTSRHPGHVLKVFDCYRPVRAVRRFAEWSREPGASAETGFYHPAIPRRRLFALGYIAAQSGHSMGNAVDLTIERTGEAPDLPGLSTREGAVITQSPETPASCTAPGAAAARSSDSASELDMGTAFDCFDTRSNTHNSKITAGHKRARQMLHQAMEEAGFKNFPKEWWHFTFPAGASRTPQDFPVSARR